jgi:hypothetical protein
MKLRLIAVLCACTSIAAAQPRSDLQRLFPKQAAIAVEPSAARLARLELPAEVISACQPDLSDLRIFDGSGREVAYLVDHGGTQALAPALRQTVVATPEGVERSKTPRKGEDESNVNETYSLAVPSALPKSGAWDLVFEASSTDFVRRVDVEQIENGTVVRPVATGSIFRLPSGAERTRIALPAAVGRKLRVTVTGQDRAYLDPRLRFESTAALAGDRRIILPLPAESQDQVHGRTRVELPRPPGIVPGILRLSTTTAAFHRSVEVHDLGPGSRDVVIGAGPLIRGAAPFEQVDLPVGPARGTRLRVVIDDGDSPVLEQIGFSAILDQPNLIFALASNASGGQAGTLRFGGARALRPRYDLSALVPPPGSAALGKHALAAASLYDPATLSTARIGTIRDNSSFDATPLLSFAMHAGADLDTRPFSHRRDVTVTPSRDGLSRVVLDPADLTVARSDLADLRIVDAQSKQWPYLIEPSAGEQWITSTRWTRDRRGRSTHYRFRFDNDPVLFDHVRLASPESYFDRPFRLLVSPPEGQDTVPLQGRLVHGAAQMPGTDLTFELPATRAKSIELVVDDGENASLELASFQIRVPLPVLYLAAPPGTYSLLLGQPEAVAPVYDLERVRDMVLTMVSAPAAVLPVQANPTFSRQARLASGRGPQQILLWVVLGLAVVALGGITLRIARTAPGGSRGA